MKMVASTTIYKLLFFVIGTLALTACNNTELETTIQQQNDRIIELEAQLEELSEYITENKILLNDILELERQLEFWQNISMEGINSEFLPYITIDEGYALIGYFHQAEEQFDFHLYQLRWYLELEELTDGLTWERVEIVVVQNDEVLGVVSSDNWPPLVGEHGHRVMELPMPFEGYDGFLIPRISLGMWRFYELYFMQNGELIHIPEFVRISNPTFDFATEVVTSSAPTDSGGFRRSIYRLIDGEFVEVERLDIFGNDRVAQVLIDGEWIEQPYDENRWFQCHWTVPGLFDAYYC